MKRHKTDVLSLVAGLFFLGVVVIWALDRAGVLHDGGRWAFPGLLVVIGAVGLASALPRRRGGPVPDGNAGPDTGQDSIQATNDLR